MVCYMYYTDVFVGTGNIEKLKNALEAELGGSELTDDLTQLETQLDPLASGLGFLAGLPACLCKTKKSVEKGLKKIYEELKNFNCINSKLNCPSCNSKLYPCKCCVIQSIKDVKECPCLKGRTCHCAGKDVSCAKVLAGLEACLHLQCLQSDMDEICECSGDTCCLSGKCNGTTGTSPSCTFCSKLKPGTPVPTTGLGLSPPNPIRLAQRLETFFGGKSSFETLCKCDCKGSTSCCCLSCGTGKCSQACSCKGSGSCSSQHSQECPCKTFCIKINSIKVLVGSADMKCCDSGTKCHCHLPPTSGSSDQTCCVGQKKSIKCLIRRLVLYFKDLQPLSSSVPSKENFKNCCDLLCVIKTCEFLKGFYNKSRQGCSKCKPNGGSCPGSSGGSCCKGNFDDCVSNPKCCSGCEVCEAKKFYHELSQLKHSSPCGQDLWRTLDDFLNFICYVFYPRVKGIQGALENLHKQHCKQCTPGSCTCSTKGSCLGCTAVLEKLQDHKDLLSLMTRGYVSSYVNSTWDSLCPKSSSSKCCCGLSSCLKCSSSSLCCKSPSVSSCDPKNCCPDCPQRKAAKIFLGMLPCLYYALKYLYKQCKGDWRDFLISNKDYSLRHFLSGMGFDLAKLQDKKGSEIFTLLSPLFTSSDGPLKKLYDVSKKYFTSRFTSLVPSSDSKPKPKTVRDILLWLSGLPFTSGFEALLNHCKGLCKPVENSVTPENFESYLFDSCFLSPFVLGAIEDSEDAFKNFPPYKSEWQKFSYPSDSSALADMLFEYVRKIYIPLNFLQYQCGRPSARAGWQDCAYGQGCAQALKKPLSTPAPAPSGSVCCSPSAPHGYLCTSVPGESNYHEHCMNGNQCIGLGTCDGTTHTSANCKPCPHHLVRFLIDGSENSKNLKNLESPFQPPEDFPKMGFKTEQLPSPGRHGRDLYDVLNSFCGLSSSPLTKLFDFSLFVAMRPPETLIELYAFFVKFRLNLLTEPLKSNFASYASEEPGTPDGQALQKAIEKLDDFSGHPGGSASHPADLKSLYACDVPTSTCGRYLFPLNNINGVFTPEFCGLYLSIVCHLGLKLHAMFQKFHEEAKGKFSCCLKDSSSKCPKIVTCPCALPFLYSWGFTFYQPERLNCHGTQSGHTPGQNCILKSCQNFIDQLGKVLQVDAPLHLLINAIDAFLWSIRKPFFFFVLAFWAFVISYFLYVQLYKLDVLELNSHDHPAWSFKILPSTLFSDASSKLKDLSYFTL
ncbi:variant erythrocyte surface antigen-1 family protein [Babesia divergens]|uniref:Variant erythrocyte surface antigen-1 family protein n=1 Tax=Babesia divergens TaxID=32595 RepID=A0AAD9LE62_BABDI|nr:variant erythrocyte surface antigen-1 family protein [Babesia divergens]